MAGERKKFHDLNESIQGQVRFDDGSTVHIKGKGSVIFHFKSGEQRLLIEVYYVPALRNNIISCGQLAEGGNKILMQGEYLLVYESSGMLLIKIRSSPNRLYKATMESSEPVCLLANISDVAWLWHARLGHVNFHSMKMMTEKEMVIGVPPITHPNRLYQNCLVAKHARQPFPVATNYRAKEALELLHVDLCGPITPTTLAGNGYFMLIVDDYSRWM